MAWGVMRFKMSARYDWVVNQGETTSLTYERTLTSDGSAIDFAAGVTFRMKAKDTFGGTVAIDLDDTAFAKPAANSFTVTIPATDTAAVAAPGTYVYDIEAVEGAVVTRVLEGKMIVRPEVTT